MEFNAGVEEYGPSETLHNPYAEDESLQAFKSTRVPGEEYIHYQSVIVDGHCGVSATAFDAKEELLWMGSQGGHVTSYYSSGLQKYTSFQVATAQEIRQLETIEMGLLALTTSMVRLYQRRGIQILTYNFLENQNAQCMVTLPHSGNLIIGGQELIELDLSSGGELISSTPFCEEGCAIMRSHPRFICCGEITGKISFMDPITMKVQSSIETHSGVLSDFDVRGNILVSCGFSNRHGSLAVDRFLKFFDLRMMKATAPIQVIFPPYHVRFLPAFSSRLCVVSQGGQFELLDTDSTSQTTPFIHTVDTGGAALLSFAASTSCQALAFGDAGCSLHLFGASHQICFNSYSQPTEFADEIEPIPPIDINDEITPLSSIPVPYCDSKLLSDWPLEYSKVVYRRTPPIDSQILSTMKMVGPIGYAPNPGTQRRNQVVYLFERKGRNVTKDVGNIPNFPELIPTRYLRIEAKYSRMGVEEFDFNLYNSTCFAGLEANLPNCYCNNLIQVFYFIEPLRCALLSHCCQREFCLACELGFLFHMLDCAQGMPCQASNFLRAFRTIPEASALGLILPDSDEARKKVNFPQLVQSWIRFILQQILMETQEIPNDGLLNNGSDKKDESNLVNQIFGSRLRSTNMCRCGQEREQESTTLLCSLVYPDHYPGKPQLQATFAHLLESSLSVEHTMPAWCDNCEKYQPMMQTKRLQSLPDVLIVNCGLDNTQDIQFWKSQIELSNGGTSRFNVSGSLTEYGGGSSIIRKPCRYGDLCTRLDCRFAHPRDKGKNLASVSPQPMSSNRGDVYAETPPPILGESWLPLELTILLEETGSVKVTPGPLKMNDNEGLLDDNVLQEEPFKGIWSTNDESSPEEIESRDGTIPYELTSVIIVVKDPVNSGKENVVTLVKVGPVSHVRHQGGPVSQWYLFNDFTIVPIAKEEAVFLNFDWKLPCLLFYSRKDINSRHQLEVHNPLTSDVYREDVSLATCRGGRIPITFTPLRPEEEELLRPGDIVAMDAEFVTLNQEEAEIRSDGTRSTIRPSQMSVARISCVRGQGQLEGVPFIDDYISTQEQVVDYLTKFSGIQPGDLDASISSKHLTTLKATYKKLRHLIDLGVKFVGHGLKNDFRVINLVVPADQVIDTVFLFQQANKRMVSLRFLAWHFLGLKIQAETHDSIEDAKTALRLYRKYQMLEKSGKLAEALKELYEKGRILQWKVPSLDED